MITTFAASGAVPGLPNCAAASRPASAIVPWPTLPIPTCSATFPPWPPSACASRARASKASSPAKPATRRSHRKERAYDRMSAMWHVQRRRGQKLHLLPHQPLLGRPSLCRAGPASPGRRPRSPTRHRPFPARNQPTRRSWAGRGLAAPGDRESTFLVFFGACNGSSQAEQNIDAPGHVALDLPESLALFEHMADCGAEQRVEAIGATGQPREQQAKDQQLFYRRSSGGINKLWQEGIVEESSLWIEQVHQDPVGEEAGELLRRPYGGRGLRIARQEGAHAQNDQVGCAQILHHSESQGRGQQQRRQP